MADDKALLLALADAAQRARLAEEVFAQAGYGVQTTDSCAGVRASVREREPSLLVLGDSLPDGDALELAEELRTAQPNLPIILVAEKNSVEQVLTCMRIGVVDYLGPPYSEEELLQAVERGLQHGQNWQAWLSRQTGRITGPMHKRLSELEAILQRVDDGVLVLDESKQVILSNPALREAFALGEKEIVGQPAEQLFANSDLLQAIEVQLAGDKHVEVISPDGHTFSLRTAQVEGVGTVASLHDISYLRELDRLRGDFVNTVSHDLRSPLTAILGYVELIERAGEINAQQAEFINRVKHSVASTTTLIEDLLNLGRVEVGVVDDLEELKLDELAADIIEAQNERAKGKDLVVRIAKVDQLPRVQGSRTQLRQMVDNLIGNAVKYAPKGGEVRVMLREEDGQVILHVADNGPGIPTEEQKRIFEKFYRAKNVDTTVQGTGLGLAIVKTVVDNHRGRIWVDSKPGRGSVFTVVLPIAENSG